MREDVIGRANVADTPELEAYYRELEQLEMGALWTVANAIEPWYPQPVSVPVLWRYRDIKPHVVKAPELVRPEDAGRRVVMLVNPGRRDVSACVGLLYTGVQIMNPGESTSAHRHMASALRFIMEGSGAYTIVDGEKLSLGARDFVLTPNGTWHDHGVDADGSQCIWQDGLDMPLVNMLDANFYEVHPEIRQAAATPLNHSWNLSGGGFVQPTEVRRNWKKPYSPLLKYPWDATYEALCRAAQSSDGSPFDGIIMDYINPVTGGHVMQTMGASIQLLRPGERTKAHRHTGSFCYQAAKGRGYTIINGRRFDWEEKDIFVIPSWAIHEHGNASDSEDACLFSFHDLPVMQALGIYREEPYAENGGHQKIIS